MSRFIIVLTHGKLRNTGFSLGGEYCHDQM